MDGLYVAQAKINGITNPNSGKNVVYLVPSLRLVSEKFSLQVGMGVPIMQQANGNQPQEDYYLGGLISLSFF